MLHGKTPRHRKDGADGKASDTVQPDMGKWTSDVEVARLKAWLGQHADTEGRHYWDALEFPHNSAVRDQVANTPYGQAPLSDSLQLKETITDTLARFDVVGVTERMTNLVAMLATTLKCNTSTSTARTQGNTEQTHDEEEGQNQASEWAFLSLKRIGGRPTFNDLDPDLQVRDTVQCT